MGARQAVAVYRVAFALLTVSAILTQMASVIRAGTFDGLHYFSYFTIDSNLIAVAVFLIGAARWNTETGPAWDYVRGASVVYMTVVGVVFTVLLSGTDVDTAIPWVNSAVHELMPLVVLADWLIDPPATRLSIAPATAWLAFPLVWIVYTLIKGPIVGKYPYPFLNPANGGYGSIAAYCVAILAFMLAVGAAVVWMGNLRSRAATVAA